MPEEKKKEDEKLETDSTSLGSSSSSKIIIYIVIGAVVSYIFYSMFFGNREKEENKQNVDEIVVRKGGSNVFRDEKKLDFNPVLDMLDTQPSIDSINSGTNTEINIPAVPSLPRVETPGQNILLNTAEEKPKEPTYTKEEVDAMIQEQIKLAMEKQINELSVKNDITKGAEKTPEVKKVTKRKRVPIINPETGKEETIEVDVEEEVIDNTKKDEKKKKKNDEVEEDEDEVPMDGLDTKKTKSSKKGKKGDDTEETDEDMLSADVVNEKASQKRRVSQERKNAPIFRMAAGGGEQGNTNEEAIILTYATNAKTNIETKAPDISGQQIQDLSSMILQGKIINAILETAIDTSEQATVRAVITKDVYAEEGKNILIPRGSKVIGSYSSNITAGKARLMINWNRIIRIDGMSLNIASIAADRLGRAGITGELDNKYAVRLANSLLSSVLSVGMAIATNKINKSSNMSINVSADGVTHTTASATDLALKDITQNFMNESKEIIDEMDQTQQPVIRIGQGERIIIMVTQDVSLPIYKVGK